MKRPRDFLRQFQTLKNSEEIEGCRIEGPSPWKRTWIRERWCVKGVKEVRPPQRRKRGGGQRGLDKKGRSWEATGRDSRGSGPWRPEGRERLSMTQRRLRVSRGHLTRVPVKYRPTSDVGPCPKRWRSSCVSGLSHREGYPTPRGVRPTRTQ